MPINSPNAVRVRKLLLGLIFVTLCVVAVFAYYENTPWKVPEEAKRRPNPIEPSASGLAAGRSIYMDKCTQCHGQTGKGDGPDAASYYPSPTSLIDAKHKLCHSGPARLYDGPGSLPSSERVYHPHHARGLPA